MPSQKIDDLLDVFEAAEYLLGDAREKLKRMEEAVDALAVEPTIPKRLLNLQIVGGSHNSTLGQVSQWVCNAVQGWNAHVQNRLQPLLDRVGPNVFDLWLHNPGGAWPDRGVLLRQGLWATMLFEQMVIARERFPELVQYGPLATRCKANGIDLYGYVGLPLCDDSPHFDFELRPDHGDQALFQHWYRELLEHGFKGIGHDSSAGLTADSLVMTQMFPSLRSYGIEPFIETVPFHYSPHLLGQSVVAEGWAWERAEVDPDRYSESDIVDAGGRAIQLLLHPDRINDPEYPNVHTWRFKKAHRLLSEGSTVAVDLFALMHHGHPIEKLVSAAQ